MQKRIREAVNRASERLENRTVKQLSDVWKCEEMMRGVTEATVHYTPSPATVKTVIEDMQEANRLLKDLPYEEISGGALSYMKDDCGYAKIAEGVRLDKEGNKD